MSHFKSSLPCAYKVGLGSIFCSENRIFSCSNWEITQISHLGMWRIVPKASCLKQNNGSVEDPEGIVKSIIVKPASSKALFSSGDVSLFEIDWESIGLAGNHLCYSGSGNLEPVLEKFNKVAEDVRQGRDDDVLMDKMNEFQNILLPSRTFPRLDTTFLGAHWETDRHSLLLDARANDTQEKYLIRIPECGSVIPSF